jgi:hypothetical protein
VLGEKRAEVEEKVASESGLGADKVSGMFEMLAPVVMGALGKEKKEKGLDVGAITDLLTGSSREAEEKDNVLGSILSVLDGDDGGGDKGGGLMSKLSGMLGSFLGRKN